MAVSVNGLGSGLDITSIVNSLMAVEALPQQQLKSTQSQQEQLMGVLRGLNTKAAALATLATKTGKPNAANLLTATSSAQNVTATATGAASPGAIDVLVSQVARTQLAVTAPMSAWPADGAGSAARLTFVDSTGATTEVAPKSTSLDDVVSAVNASGGPVRALKVSAGTDGSGTPLYRLQLTAAQGGAKGAFTAYEGSAAEVTAGTATDLMSRAGSAVVSTAQDAKVTLYAGTAAEQVVSSSTNTFTDLLPGVSVTTTPAAVGTSATITVASDAAGISKQANDLVTAVNDLLGTIAANSSVRTTTSSSGTSGASGGALTGNSTMRSVAASITDAVYRPTANGRSPSELGIAIQRDGTIAFDQAKFSAALAADGAGTRAALEEISSRVGAAATSASAPASGSISQLIAGRQSIVNDLSSRVAGWDQRLADRRTALFKMYNAMDTALGTLKSQQTWLTSQIAGLPTTSSNSK
ncbi:flagellar filament capping protein FliD [Terrabacter aeriphilus]|uniref:Flagellar hook-associated protein 2 n=1 Tax=Terrabacter aeriphilus TaxID=515662 RepID=A0ABP9JA49_9MICO